LRFFTEYSKVAVEMKSGSSAPLTGLPPALNIFSLFSPDYL